MIIIKLKEHWQSVKLNLEPEIICWEGAIKNINKKNMYHIMQNF